MQILLLLFVFLFFWIICVLKYMVKVYNKEQINACKSEQDTEIMRFPKPIYENMHRTTYPFPCRHVDYLTLLTKSASRPRGVLSEPLT